MSLGDLRIHLLLAVWCAHVLDVPLQEFLDRLYSVEDAE